MTPIVNGLEEEFSGQLTVQQLNAEEVENAQLMQEYGLRGHPSFAILTEDGRLSKTFFGPQSEAQLRKAIQAIVPISESPIGFRISTIRLTNPLKPIARN